MILRYQRKKSACKKWTYLVEHLNSSLQSSSCTISYSRHCPVEWLKLLLSIWFLWPLLTYLLWMQTKFMTSFYSKQCLYNNNFILQQTKFIQYIISFHQWIMQTPKYTMICVTNIFFFLTMFFKTKMYKIIILL